MDIMGFTDPLMLQIDVPGEPRYLQESIADIIAFLPRLIGAVALAIGIAFGLGGRDYVATNIGDWLPGRAPDPESTPMGQPDGGEESTD